MEITTMKTTWKMQMSKTIEDSSRLRRCCCATHISSQPSQVLTDWSSNCSSWLVSPEDLHKINKWQFVIDFYRQTKIISTLCWRDDRSHDWWKGSIWSDQVCGPQWSLVIFYFVKYLTWYVEKFRYIFVVGTTIQKDSPIGHLSHIMTREFVYFYDGQNNESINPIDE